MAVSTTSTRGIGERLLAALHDIDRPQAVCTSGDRPLVMPGLGVDGLGTVPLPLGKRQAKQLIKLCRQAPYGKGTETLVDTDVRRVWELDPGRFQLTNPTWNDLVISILVDVQRELGLEERKLAAQLYKLLVYEEGGFFLPHRDGEKLDRMVATLVIGLPSVHTGGELAVTHGGRSHELVMRGAASGFDLSYAAFYADCQHEVRPLESGYRLCLTYNVTLPERRGKNGIVAPDFQVVTQSLADLLTDWRNRGTPEKLVVTLDHRYTQAGLGLETLKGVDRARADVLFAAAERADCIAHLALVTLWQCGASEGGYDDYYSGRSGRSGSYLWSDNEDDAGYGERTGEHQMGELFDHSLSADYWFDRNGRRIRLGEIRLSEEDIIAHAPFTDGEPSREEYEGYTGNAGMTLERWYHRAAIIIWPRSRHFQVLCAAGTDAAIGGLQPLVKKLARAPKSRREQQRQECLAFAGAIIDSWQPQSRFRRRANGEQDQIDRNVFPQMLYELEAADLVRRFLSTVLTADGDVQLDRSFARFCKQHGWDGCEADLVSVIEASAAATIVRNANLLNTLCRARDKSRERIALAARLSAKFVDVLERFDRQAEKDDWEVERIDRAELLNSLVPGMVAINAEEPLSRLLQHALTAERYDLTETHLAAIFGLESSLRKRSAQSAAIDHWLSACRSELERRTAVAPQAPTDFRRADELSCNCRDCQALSAFLADPQLKVARFPLAKQRRQHLHQIIERHECDCTHVTERRGSPHVLVCTKTTASHAAAVAIHERDLKNLSRVVALITYLNESAPD